MRVGLFRDSVVLEAEEEVRLLLERRLSASVLSGGALFPRRAMAVVARANQLNAGLSATLPQLSGALVQEGILSPDVTTYPYRLGSGTRGLSKALRMHRCLHDFCPF